MKLKQRFALLFTLFVAIILFISCITIYILYRDYRTEDYYRRLHIEGQKLFDEYVDLRINHKQDLTEKLNAEHKNVLNSEIIVICDTAQNIIFKKPDTLNFFINKTLLKNVAANNDYQFKDDNNYQHIGFYVNEVGVYVFVSAFDKIGLQRLQQMGYILIFVFIGGLFLTVVLSLFFVNQALKPLTELSLQMQKINASNLFEHLPEITVNDELQQITGSFNKMLNRLNNAFETQRSFVHNASHELRTPLTVMLSQTEAALNKNISPEEVKILLRSLKEDQLSLIELTNSLLLLSQYEKLPSFNSLPLIRIDEVIFEAIATTQKIYPSANISLSFKEHPANEKQLMLPISDALLKAAFINLIKNAVIYSFNKKVDINIENTGTQIIINIENNGQLIAQKDIQNLMQPFFRSDNAVKIKGFGLGLSIAKRIIDIHDGQLIYNPIEPNINRFSVIFSINQ
ncbi:MAG: HAMP domain-containing histidine kinase [Bacteroidetes bacterium]|nr:HAMP domain-containing histidine kinase [Bacteroidota bacterium]MBS1590513.1 HAMP domain-containing histidine kinase [Bacteroidota bacterium]